MRHDQQGLGRRHILMHLNMMMWDGARNQMSPNLQPHGWERLIAGQIEVIGQRSANTSHSLVQDIRLLRRCLVPVSRGPIVNFEHDLLSFMLN
jgi:hypothetical protein